jgi:hypothetical protein
VHSEFADWYRIASVDVAEVDLKARWAAVEKAVEGFSTDDLLDASRVFYGLAPKATDFDERFRRYFKDADDKFRMLDNGTEVRVLCGAVLVGLLDIGGDWTNAAALAATCPSFQGARASAVGDIVRVARERLASNSALLRHGAAAPTLSAGLVKNLGQHIANLLAAIKANTSLSPVHPQFEQALESLSDGVSQLADWAVSEQKARVLRQEETNVLWWVFGGYSRDLHVPFSDIKAPAAIMIAGKEMADLSGTIPGPYSARAFLDKQIRESVGRDTTTLAEVINACPAEWRNSVSAKPDIQPVEDLCPTLFALRKATETSGKKTWTKVFESVTALSSTERRNPIDLAEQTFQEWLFARAIAQLNEE